MSTGSYFLVNFNNRDKLIPAIESLSDNPNLIRWDAVDGHYNLIVKAKSDIAGDIKSLEGFAHLDSCKIESDNEKGAVDPEFIYAYVYIECDQSKKESVVKSIESLDSLEYSVVTSGSFDIIALFKGETFGDIDKVANNHIRNLDGVLRCKQDHVIYLDRI